MTSRRSYRDPGYIARVLGRFQDIDSVRDWSEEILMFLALAYNAAQRLKDEQGSAALELTNVALISPSIERAFRETLYVRRRQSEEYFSSGNWPIKLSRDGDIENKVKDTS